MISIEKVSPRAVACESRASDESPRSIVTQVVGSGTAVTLLVVATQRPASASVIYAERQPAFPLLKARRYVPKPRPPKPMSIIAQVEASGTPVTIGGLPMPALKTREYSPASGVPGAIVKKGSTKALTVVVPPGKTPPV